MQPNLRHVVIGVGAGIFDTHRPAPASGPVELVGVSDINVITGEQRAAELGYPFYPDYRTMLADTRPDVAVVMPPHPFHAPIASG